MKTKNLINSLVLLIALLGVSPTADAQFFFDPPVPNWNISFAWDGIDVNEGGVHEFALSQEKESAYTWPSGASGQIYGEIYRGELNNAVLVATHMFDSSGMATSVGAPNDFQDPITGRPQVTSVPSQTYVC